jgi:hypothetical protein
MADTLTPPAASPPARPGAPSGVVRHNVPWGPHWLAEAARLAPEIDDLRAPVAWAHEAADGQPPPAPRARAPRAARVRADRQLRDPLAGPVGRVSGVHTGCFPDRPDETRLPACRCSAARRRRRHVRSRVGGRAVPGARVAGAVPRDARGRRSRSAGVRLYATLDARVHEHDTLGFHAANMPFGLCRQSQTWSS